VKIYPRQYVYPKYCPDHRNEYRRVRHLQQIGRQDLIESMMKEGESMEVRDGKAAQAKATSKTSKKRAVA
jgi:hypothetical protein